MLNPITKHIQQINYVVEGDGPPVILVHGIAASLYDWEYLIPELVKARYRAYALDLIGHGDSAKPEDHEHYHFESLYAHLAAWISNLHLSHPPLLIGHSLGGFLCLKYAHERPEFVQGMVLIDPFYTPRQLSPMLRALNRRPRLGEKALDMAPLWLIQAVMGWDTDTTRNLSLQTRQQIAEDYKRASPKITHMISTATDLTPALSEVTSPALVIWGDNDLTLKPRYFPALVEQLPNASAFPISGCGHQPHLGKPDLVNSLVLDFLREI
jgi:pimeloyl-ACP methyl ester carboxylesterase